MSYLLSLIFLGTILYEVPKLLKDRRWAELTAFSVLLLVAMLYGYAQVLSLPLPNPATGLNTVFNPASQYLDKMLK